MPSKAVVAALLIGVGGMLGCAGERPQMLRATVRGGGPVIKYDLRHKPLPEVPMPNDSATILDDSSPTGRRVNVSFEAATEVERRMRRRANTLPGFGIAMPLTVSFDAPLDYEDLRERHVGNKDPGDDGVLLLRLGPGEACAEGRLEGRLHPVDVGHGHYPLVLERPCQYHFHPWEGDYNCQPKLCNDGDDIRTDASNIVFDTVEEDTNGNGVLDPYEDTDFDGHLDRPNTFSGEDHGNAAADDLITFYEKQTNTLVLWPIVPLLEGTSYAVVLTKNLKGADGAPVESPFDGIAAPPQAPELAQIEELLPCYDLGLDDVAFAWKFTTAVPSRELVAVRAGLYGHGPMAFLGEGTPPEELRPYVMRDADDEGNLPDEPYTLPMKMLKPLLVPLTGALLETPKAGEQLAADTVDSVEYWIYGEYASPDLRVDRDGRATPLHPDDDDEIWELDVDEGEAVWAPGKVPFLCGIPQTTEEHKPPFPVVLYAHGYSGATFEILGFAGRYAQKGYALCAIEAPGHGLIIPESDYYIFELLKPLVKAAGLETFFNEYYGGRARDLDNSGVLGQLDQGTDFLVADVFHTRDNLRQLALDLMQLVRVLRSADGVRTMNADTDGDGEDDLLCDFDGDGVPDIGGWADEDGDGVKDPGEPDNPFYMWGQSLGGIASTIMAAVEPAIRAAAPSSGGGMLTMVGTRSINPGVPEAAYLPMMGPFIAFRNVLDSEGEPTGEVMVRHLVANANSPGRYTFHVSEEMLPGDRLIVRNLKTGKEVRGFVPDEPRPFRIGIGADALRPGEKREILGLTDEDNGPVEVTGDLALALGDPLEVIVLDGWDGPVKERIDTVNEEFTFQGATFVEGSPLVAIGEGLGYPRNSPDLRRLLGLAQMILEPGDPITYAPHIKLLPFDFPYETGLVKETRESGRLTSFVLYHSAGDADVPVSTGLNIVRAAGILDFQNGDPAYGKSHAEVLIDHHITEGVERIMRYTQRKETAVYCPPAPESEWRCPAVRPGEEDRYRAFFDEDGKCPADHGDCEGGCPDDEVCFYDAICVPCDPKCAAIADFPLEGVHFDIDDSDDGTDRMILPEYNLDPPLRLKIEAESGVYGLRLPYLNREGSHGVPPSIPERAFDINGFTVNQILSFFANDGKRLDDDPCLIDGSCDFAPWH